MISEKPFLFRCFANVGIVVTGFLNIKNLSSVLDDFQQYSALAWISLFPVGSEEP